MLKKVAYSSCPMDTAYYLAKNLTVYIRAVKGTEVIDLHPVAIDIPLNIQANAIECMAFMRIHNPLKNIELKTSNNKHRILETCRGKYAFEGHLI